MTSSRWIMPALCAPAAIVLLTLFIIPVLRLIWVGGTGPNGFGAYAHVLQSPRHLQSLLITIALAGVAAALGVLLGTPVGLLLGRTFFKGHDTLEALLTMPASLPGVVIGFMVIQLAGRQGAIGHITQIVTGHRLTFAYSSGGLLLGYVYFSIPRVIATIAASARAMPDDTREAARSLGAGRFHVFRDVTLPILRPAMFQAAAIVFATSMSAFGTAYALGADIPVLPLTIYDDFSTGADLPSAIAASLMLALTTFAVLTLAGRMKQPS